MTAPKSSNNKTKHRGMDAFDGKLEPKLFDALNIKIVRELINNPDISSTDIAARYDIPLSTIQRRRAKLEQSVISKSYALDIRKLG